MRDASNTRIILARWAKQHGFEADSHRVGKSIDKIETKQNDSIENWKSR